MHRIPTSLAPKIVGETDNFSAVFALASGETIVSATTTCTPAWGTDAAASSMVGDQSISGNTVTTSIDAGVAGNIYQLRFTATLSTERVLTNDIWFEVRA